MENSELTLDGDTVPQVERVAAERYFVRLNTSERVQHMLFALCFIVLVL